jgi:uncharacterized RDD family membrane protein YckC
LQRSELVVERPLPTQAVIRARTESKTHQGYAVDIAMPTEMPAYAGVGIRALALLIDYVFLAILAGLPMIGRHAVVSPEGFGWEHTAWVVVFSCPYFAISEASGWQGTLGKKLIGLRVADLNGVRIGFGRAIVRHLAKLLAYPIWFASLFTIMYMYRNPALHDLVAKTVVLRPGIK